MLLSILHSKLLSIPLIVPVARDKSEKTFAFAYMKIMRDDGSIIPDGQHELYIYKVGVVTVT